MAILVNWFEVTFDRKEVTLPFLASPSWEESTTVLERYPAMELVRVRQADQTIRLYFVTGHPEGDFTTETVSLAGPRAIAARLIEYNLAKHFEKLGARVVINHRWGIDATREAQQFAAIGLTVHQGINAKYFAVTEPRLQHGITLNWITPPFFTLPVSQLPATRSYDGFPVLLQWPRALGECPKEIAPFDHHYLGTIIESADNGCYRVSVRDQSQQVVDGRALFLEPKTDVLAEMEQVLTRETGHVSIQRRILQLSHSLKPDGRRNPGILRDQLASALRVLDPSDRGQVSIPLIPNAEGKMWISCYATGVQRS
ncbi:MAG TPA: hypothetical protein PKI20_14815 [Verrucomicrobiota bacterium]|nr:hypothetical protein [Verrucomicrobiota bacterium]